MMWVPAFAGLQTIFSVFLFTVIAKKETKGQIHYARTLFCKENQVFSRFSRNNLTFRRSKKTLLSPIFAVSRKLKPQVSSEDKYPLCTMSMYISSLQHTLKHPENGAKRLENTKIAMYAKVGLM